MGNLLKGVSSESANVVARCPERKSLAEAQSLNPSPALRSGFCSCGMANAPNATTGASFSNSRRFMLLNLRLSTREAMEAAPAQNVIQQEYDSRTPERLHKPLRFAPQRITCTTAASTS